MKTRSILKGILKSKQILIVLLMIAFINTAKADYTINSGVTVDPNNVSSLLNATGIINIYGAMEINSTTTFGSTTPLNIIIYGSNGTIIWKSNVTLTLPAGSTITFVNNPTNGLQGTPASASKVLKIGNVSYAAANDNSNNVVYSFTEMNAIGGTAKVAPSASIYAVCAGSSTNLNANQVTPAGDVIKVLWSVSPNAGSFSANNSSAASSTVLSGLTANTYTVKCDLFSDAGGGNYFVAASKSITITVSNPGTWLGVNSDWNSTSNWCNGTIPTATTDVTIGAGLSNYPIITTTALVRNLSINTGGTVTVNSTGKLSIAGTIASTNAITANAGTIEMIGSTTQSISGNNFASNTIANLIINNSLSGASSSSPSVAVASTGGMLKIANTLSFGSRNSMVLITNDNISLLSTATATARVADITNNDVNTGNAINGKFVIERYIPAKRSWRLLTAPVTAASQVKISDSWQEGATRVTNPAATITSGNNPNPGYGTHVTYGSPAANGYDQGINSSTNIKYLTSTGWNGVPTATNNGSTANSGYITDQPGYFLFVRGNRSTQLSLGTAAAATTTTLRIKGAINTGTVNVALGTKYLYGATSNFYVIKNPFPSAINFNKILQNTANTTAGFANAFYMWDPNIGSNAVGGWVAMSYSSSTGKYIRNVIPSGIDSTGDIQSGSAIMIDYNGAATTLQIKESNKVSGSNITQFRPAAVVVKQLRTSLLEKYPDGFYHVNDGALISFDENNNNAVDGNDMKKLTNFSENFSILKGDNTISIENRMPVASIDTIFYSTTQFNRKNYALEFTPEGLIAPEGTAAFLEDTYLKTATPIHLKDTTRYTFNVTDNASANAQRFRLVFKPSLNFISANGITMNDDALISWELKEELNINHFEVERSVNGKLFTTTGIIESKGNSTSIVNYSFTDTKPATGNYLYRIKGISNDSIISYSKVLPVKIVNSKPGMYIYPNPVTNNSIGLQINTMKAGTYSIKLYNAVGMLLHSSTLQNPGGAFSNNIDPQINMADGNYFLVVTCPDNKMIKLSCTVIKK